MAGGADAEAPRPWAMTARLFFQRLPDQRRDRGAPLRRDQPEPIEQSLGEGNGGAFHSIMLPASMIINNQLGVECAAELLRQGAGSVTEVAYSVGFESLSYFSRAFREHFGTTPSEHCAAPTASAPPRPEPD